MEHTKKTLDRYAHILLNLDNTIGVGVGFKEVKGQKTKQKSIIIFVENKVPVSRLKKNHVIPRVLDNILTDVIEVGNIILHNRKEKSRPAQPGSSIGHYKITAGTFGATVKDKNTSELLILSNNHILANGTNGSDGKSNIGDPILQPGSYDGGTMNDIIANLERYIPVYKNVIQPTCKIAKTAEKIANSLCKIVAPHYNFTVSRQVQKQNLVDAAVARPVSPDYIEQKIIDIGDVTGVEESAVGMAVLKSGRTSGLTEGEIKAIHVSVNVNMDQGTTATFTDQIITNAISQPGDSGSLVLNKDNKAVGLLFAGSDKITICNRIQNVMQLLNVTFEPIKSNEIE